MDRRERIDRRERMMTILSTMYTMEMHLFHHQSSIEDQLYLSLTTSATPSQTITTPTYSSWQRLHLSQVELDYLGDKFSKYSIAKIGM